MFNAHSISTLTTSAPSENIATSSIGVGGNNKTIIRWYGEDGFIGVFPPSVFSSGLDCNGLDSF